MPRRIGLIVGNGLAIDLRHTVKPSLSNWDTQHPLQWRVPTPGDEDRPFINALPEFDNAITDIRGTYPGIRDFDLIAKALERLPAKKADWSYEQRKLRVEMRHFLAVAFSHYQRQVNNLDLETWRWRHFLKSIGEHLTVAVSFNYDLILETLLRLSGLQPRRFALPQETDGIWFFKPHGSIDFAPGERAIEAPAGYPLVMVNESNDVYLRRLEGLELTQPRIQADIVLPSEYSPYSRFQWVRPGYDWLKIAGAALTEVWIIGISYWAADRSEINYMLQCAPRWAEINVVNPTPDEELIHFLRGHFTKVALYPSCPEFNTGTVIRPDVPLEVNKFANETVRLLDLIFDSNVIAGLTFDGCRIIGPCVVSFTRNSTIADCTFNDGDPSILTWETSEEGPRMGFLELRDCTFVNCEFYGIGVAGPPDYLSRIFPTTPPGAG